MKTITIKRISIQMFLLVLLTFCTGLAMPPHPDLINQIQQGKMAGSYLINQKSFQERGINTPAYHPVNSVYKKGTAPFGEFKPLVLLVDFSDKSSVTDPLFFDALIFSQESNSVRDYYKEISYGNLDIIPTDLPSDIGWLRAPRTYEHYVNLQYGLGYYPQNSQKLVEDLVGLVDSMIDLSVYDNDIDGFVDAVVIIHSGAGAEFTSNPSDMWSHKWSLPFPLSSDDGVTIKDYTIQPEYWQSSGDMTIGVFCHELGHIFGLPDLYDIDGDSKGIGTWSIMSYGSWNGYLGSSPAHPDAWCRYQLGFVDPVSIHDNFEEINVAAVEEVDVIYRLWSYGESGNEYFLVENRQKVGYDSYLSGSGILVWYVDEDVFYNTCQWYPGHVQYGHYKVALKQADGLWQLEKSINYGDAGDPFPGGLLNFNFNSNSSPNSKDYMGLETYVGVNNISPSSQVMTCDFLVKPSDIDEINQNEPSDFALKQNFPNPFNSFTIISFNVYANKGTENHPIHTDLVIYNIMGQKVKTLVNETKAEGPYEILWDGKDDEGNELSSGIYLYKLKIDNFQNTKKMIILK